MDSIRFAQRLAAAAVFALLAPFPAAAQWIPNGFAVAPDDSAQIGVAMVPDGAGGAVIAWQGRIGFRYATPATRLDAGGGAVPGWPAYVDLNPVGTSSRFDDLSLAPDGAGGAYAADAQYTYLLLHHILGTGAIDSRWGAGLWLHDSQLTPGPRAGTLASRPNEAMRTENGWFPALAPDVSGGVVASWTAETASALDIGNVTRVLPNAQPVSGWAAQGVSPGSAYGPYRNSRLTGTCADPAGGAFLAFLYDDASHQAFASKIGILHATADGSQLFVVPASADTAANEDQSALVADGTGGAFLVWREDPTGPLRQVRAQHVLATGAYAPGWQATGLLVCASPTNAGSIHFFDPATPYFHESAVSDGAGGLYIAWTDHRASAVDGDIYAQHVLGDGTLAPGWPDDGLAVCTASGDQQLPVATMDGHGGLLLAWQDARGGDDDIYAQRLDAGGAASLPANGLAICVASGDQITPQIIGDGALGAIVSWVDGRGAVSQIYASHVSYDPAVPALASFVSAEVTAAAVQMVWVADGWSGPVTVERRTAGIGWAPLVAVTPGADGRVVLRDVTVVAGERYGYRLALASAHAGETWIDVPAGAAFALEAPRPDPASRGGALAFSLPDASPASLEVLDVSGRRVFAREVGGLGPGRHTLSLADRAGLAPGVYVVRLVRGQAARDRRLVVTP